MSTDSKIPRSVAIVQAQCIICFESFPLVAEIAADRSTTQSWAIPCGHFVCTVCFKTYITHKIEQGPAAARAIACPVVGCVHKLSEKEILAVTNERDTGLYKAALAEAKQPAAVTSIADSKDPADIAFMAYASKHLHNMKQCPGCSAFVETVGGCSKMRCRCGHGFCFVCGVANATCTHAWGHGFYDVEEVLGFNGRYDPYGDHEKHAGNDAAVVPAPAPAPATVQPHSEALQAEEWAGEDDLPVEHETEQEHERGPDDDSIALDV